MCESTSLLQASNQDGHHQEETKITEMNKAEPDVSPHPTPETFGSTPLPPPSSPAFVYYPEDFRHCYDDDSHLQEDDDGDGADQLLEDDGANQWREDDAPLPPPEEDRAPTTGFAARLAEFARQKLAKVDTSSTAVRVAGVGLVGSAAVAGAYFLWPAAAVVTTAAGATMKAPGAAGFVISRAAFLANPQLYFKILHTAGATAAAAAFAAVAV